MTTTSGGQLTAGPVRVETLEPGDVISWHPASNDPPDPGTVAVVVSWPARVDTYPCPSWHRSRCGRVHRRPVPGGTTVRLTDDRWFTVPPRSRVWVTR
jgi:hypothetical protein